MKTLLAKVAKLEPILLLKFEANATNQGSLTEGEGSVRLTSSLDQLLFILKILLTSFTKQATLMRRSTVLSCPP
jgi:hypothetical protein